MNISRFFIDRPIFAGVIAIFITLIGVFAYPLLPLSQYPEIAPPTITVNAAYPGASAETLAETVAAPIEQEINGVEGMLYMTSSSTSAGRWRSPSPSSPAPISMRRRCSSRTASRWPSRACPSRSARSASPSTSSRQGFLMIVALTSTDPGIDIDYVGNYANSTLRDRLLRLEGVGGVQVFGGGNYSMRVWIDPDRAAARNLTAGGDRRRPARPRTSRSPAARSASRPSARAIPPSSCRSRSRAA